MLGIQIPTVNKFEKVTRGLDAYQMPVEVRHRKLENLTHDRLQICFFLARCQGQVFKGESTCLTPVTFHHFLVGFDQLALD